MTLILTTSAIYTDALARPHLVPNGLNAPLPSEWPPGLPKAYKLSNGDVCTPPALSDEVVGRLLLLEVYPIACADVIKANKDYLKRAHEIDMRACEQKCEVSKTEDAIQKEAGWSLWEVGLIALGALGVGFTSGYLTHTLQNR